MNESRLVNAFGLTTEQAKLWNETQMKCNNCSATLGKCQHCGAPSCHECGGKLGHCQQEPQACKKNRLAWAKKKCRTQMTRFFNDPAFHNQLLTERAMKEYADIHVS